MHILYTILLGVALLLTSPYWLVQGVLRGKYRAGLAERFGRVPSRLRPTSATENCIWIHAVSVGEVLAVSGLVEALRAKLPEWRLVISTTTLSGQTLARRKFGKDNVFYFPLDLPFAVTPYLERLRPKLVVVAETEFWPNFLRMAKKSGARIAVANARISDRSYPGYKRFRWFLSRTLAEIDMFLTQTEEDKQRLIDIGAPAGRVQVSGNLKFDVKTPAASALVGQIRSAIVPGAQVMVCGSTVAGEEEMLLDAWKRVLREYPTAVMVLAPRHPERFAEVAELLRSRAVSFWRRTGWSGEQISGGVFLLDTIGELAAMYAIANVAFVGGSLVDRGGHNILEAAQYGKPILVGPFTQNFRDIVNIFLKAGAVRIVQPSEVAKTFLELLHSEAEQKALGSRALAVFSAHPGATERTLNALEVLLWMPRSIQERYEQVKQ
jgi:3-deoxy-D-manno-octulosonic-acid transferase